MSRRLTGKIRTKLLRISLHRDVVIHACLLTPPVYQSYGDDIPLCRVEPHRQSPWHPTNAQAGRHPGQKFAHLSTAKGRGFLLPGQFALRPLCLRVGEFTWRGDLGNSGKRYFLYSAFLKILPPCNIPISNKQNESKVLYNVYFPYRSFREG